MKRISAERTACEVFARTGRPRPHSEDAQGRKRWRFERDDLQHSDVRAVGRVRVVPLGKHLAYRLFGRTVCMGTAIAAGVPTPVTYSQKA